jgi:sec-independent protein translocase protein TatB
MFDIGWSEMAVIMLVALVVIGPKDLPRLARNLGQWVAKGRAMAREFQRSLEDMAREAELDDVKREIEKVGRTDIKRSIEKTIDPTGELGRAFDPRKTLDTGSKTATPSAAVPNGEAKEPTPKKLEATSEQPVETAAAEPAPAPQPAPRPKTPAKPKTEAKAKTEAKPRPSARSKATAGDAPKTASPEAGKAETLGAPR